MSEIITFYSYKGGVGRTMALANASVILSGWGHKVLVVDWDLEAPGLEHFYSDFLEDVNIVKTKSGVIDFLQLDKSNDWKDDIISISISQSTVPIHLLSSGKRDEDYFKKVRNFDVDVFYENGGGDLIEQLRNEWLANYDYILIDSRTGITEIGGICTIQLPDTVVMLFTATNQGFEGVLDIIDRAGAAQQKLFYDRRKLIFLPVPSKFETNTEFKLSQEWLNTFVESLENVYNDWLPTSINRKDFLELTKIPYIAYFSFGEKLPVIEQGVKDPSGLGYAYETLAAIVANNLINVDWLFDNRDEYIAGVNKYPSLEPNTKRYRDKLNTERRLKVLKQQLNVNESRVIIEKSKQVVIECIQNSILPLLEAISVEMKNIGTIFKNKTEEIDVAGEYTQNIDFEDRRLLYESKLTISDLLRVTKNVYSSPGIYKDFDLTSLEYSCNFRNLRKSNNVDIELALSLNIEFHNSVFEINSDYLSLNFDKLYHENITFDEIDSIVQAVMASLLERVESALKH